MRLIKFYQQNVKISGLIYNTISMSKYSEYEKNRISKDLEKRIMAKVTAIRSGKISKEKSKIGILFDELHNVDEITYIDLVVKYKDVILTK